MRYLMSDISEFICRKNRDKIDRDYRWARNVPRLERIDIETYRHDGCVSKTCDLIRTKQNECARQTNFMTVVPQTRMRPTVVFFFFFIDNILTPFRRKAISGDCF